MSNAQSTATQSPAVAAPAKQAAGVKGAPRSSYISWAGMAFLTVSSVASLRSAPTMAVYGLACVFLYAIPAIVFLLPTSLVSAELASGWSGGVYRWVSDGISPKAGLVAIWNQYAMTIFYYPALLAYVASTFAYVIDPALAANGSYTALMIIGIYWVSVLVSSRGMKAITSLASGGLWIGTLIPGTLLVVLAIVFLGQGNPSAAPMDAGHLLPAWAGFAGLVLIINNFLAYSGMEMNAVHVNELRDPAKEFPRAMFLSIGLVLAIFILPALAISWIVPSETLSLTAGVMQAFDAVYAHFGVQWLTPVTAIALICASLGGMLAWLAGPSKGLLLIGKEQGYLPPYFQRLNKNGIQQNILVAQGWVTTVIALLYAFIPNVSTSYWIFSVITTQTYLIMYVLMFVAAARLRQKQPDHPRGYRAPMLKTLCIVGGLASVLAFLIGFIPPSQFAGGGVGYVLLIALGVGTIGLLAPFAILHFARPSWKTAQPQAAGNGEVASQNGNAARQNGDASPENGNVAAADAEPSPSKKQHVWLYVVIGAVATGLAIWGVTAYRGHEATQEANAKAAQLQDRFKAAGLPTYADTDDVARTLGTDGGAVCASPERIAQGLLKQQLSNGAGGPGQRPVTVARQTVQGELLILQTYCPEKAPEFQKFVNSLDYAEVVRP
jgi:amino acid transporter